MQTWDRFLFDGPEAWQMPLDLRRELRAMVLAHIEPAAGIDATQAFTLIDYDRVEGGEWQKEDGIRGDFVKLANGRLEVGGWDNPRDGGSMFRSLESFLRAPLLPNALADLESTLRQRIQAARCD